jgi:FAD/FMN-containing dehydrogenase
MSATAAADAALGELHGFRGEIVIPGDPSDDRDHRVWNGSIDRFPAMIARCRAVADVIAAVGLARDTGLPVAVRGGGHSCPRHTVCADGIVIDLGPMKGIRVDPQARSGWTCTSSFHLRGRLSTSCTPGSG